MSMRNNNIIGLVPIVFILLLSWSIRLIYLGADTPVYLPVNVAEHVDEGYKTLDSKNLALYGRTHWNSADEYQGWMSRSPITQWLYYFSFSDGTPTKEKARVVTTIVFLVLLLGFYFAQRRRYSRLDIIIGILLLGFNGVLFFYSRLALFEIQIATLFCLLLFFYSKRDAKFTTLILATLAVTMTTAFGIKMSSLIYAVPIMFGFLTSYFPVFQSGGQDRTDHANKIFAVLLFSGVLFSLILYLTYDQWLWHFINFFSPGELIKGIFINKFLYIAPFSVVAGMFAVSHLLLIDPGRLMENRYRNALFWLIIAAPVFLAAVGAPIRFYVPLMPAYILVAVEWLHIKAWKLPLSIKTTYLSCFMTVISLALLGFYILFTLNRLLLSQFKMGDDPGISPQALIYYALPMIFIVSILICRFRASASSVRIVLPFMLFILSMATANNLFQIGRFVAYPNYELKKISRDISSMVEKESSIAGEWAPVVTLGTGIKSIYIDGKMNGADKIKRLRPTYYLHSDTDGAKEWMEDLKKEPGVELGEPLFEGSYVGKKIILYTLKYES